MSVPLRQASREILGKSRRYRFWKTVGVQPAAGNTFQVFLDKKPVKTSTGTVLEVDKEEHALLMASEWQKGISSFNHHSLPIVIPTYSAVTTYEILDVTVGAKTGVSVGKGQPPTKSDARFTLLLGH